MDTALADIVRATRATGAMLYVLTPDRTALWLSHVAGAPREVVAPWSRVAVDDPIPVADAVREERLVWVNSQEEMARRYPRPAVVLPYDFALTAVPVASDSGVRGGLVLLWPSGHPPQLSRAEHDAVRAGSRRLGHLFEQAARRGEPVVSPGRPRILPPEPGRTPTAEEAWAGTALLDRLPGGYVGLDLNGRITLVTPAAADLVGAAPDRLLGALPWEALPWMDVPHVVDRYRAALISRTPQSFRVLRPPGTWLSFELYPDPSGISVRIDRTADAREADPVAETAHGPGRATVLYHLMHLATTLTEAVGVQDVVDQTAHQLLPALGAQAMVLMTAEDGRLRILGHRGYNPELLARFDGTPLSRDIPGAAVLATGEPGFFPSFTQMAAVYPKMTHEDGMAAWAVLPLIASNRPIGSVLLSYDRPRPFPPSERAILTSLAGLVGQALDRARLYDNKDRLAHRLQSALLPHSLPSIPGLRVVARYLPAARGLGIGGDFYDLIRLDENTAAAAIGDVQGHNVDAAALMGQVRTAVHAHATVGAPPDHVLGGTNRLLTDLDPGLFTSCLYAHLDLGNRRACLATAGHPPPLMRHCDGRTELLAVPPGLLLGIDPTARYPSLECALPPGCVLVLYTDGLVEAPGVDPDDATAALAGLVEQSDPRDLEAMADTLVRHAPAPGDDIALLLLSPTPDCR
ncbi:SpoIIE family protein phosphatase [Streptomyces cellulosae]|uniref:SpoIIE family protein phosphatase n=2 Tax=unclassified Streptomyces TaxID=2593676 RepID=UPI00048CE295|nr:SpoIIE family protein phosphatase [Streptomyces cellulosae]